MHIGVTGSSGFVGTHLTKALKQLPDVQVSLLQRNSAGSFPGIDELTSFVRDLDLIYHLAGVNRGTDEEIVQGNIEATFKLVEAVKAVGPASARIVFTSASQVYKPVAQAGKVIRESQRTDPATLYGVAKKAAEDLIRISGIDHVILRLANIYGPGCRPNYNSVIATFCHRVARGEPIQIDGDGRQGRDFLFIDDAVRALVLAGTKRGKSVSGVYNVGTGRTTSLRQVIRNLKAAGVEVNATFASDADTGKHSFGLDASRFAKRFGWKPKTAPAAGIKNTLRWFQERTDS
ncbi:MAG: NAD(P)-dependent oxidoreductase [Nitrospinae bacterium]|nr:NAD(P)-dependent oxidoreductase [Nitrospinota bacterium]